MTKSRLSACPSCSRHVRAAETRCPFCETNLPDGFGTEPVRRVPAGLSRAAMYALGVGTLSIAAASSACSSSDSTAEKAGDSALIDAGKDAAEDDDSGRASPVYGAPAEDASAPLLDASDGSPPDGGADSGD